MHLISIWSCKKSPNSWILVKIFFNSPSDQSLLRAKLWVRMFQSPAFADALLIIEDSIQDIFWMTCCQALCATKFSAEKLEMLGNWQNISYISVKACFQRMFCCCRSLFTFCSRLTLGQSLLRRRRLQLLLVSSDLNCCTAVVTALELLIALTSNAVSL